VSEAWLYVAFLDAAKPSRPSSILNKHGKSHSAIIWINAPSDMNVESSYEVRARRICDECAPSTEKCCPATIVFEWLRLDSRPTTSGL
jgi:hypothetical protein